MTTHEKALRALAQAYDREDAAQRGEPDPWSLDDPGDIGDSDTWVSERLACAQVAAEAFLSALLPEDVAGLVERLRQYEGRQWETTACYNGTRDEAASLIQSLTARIAELEAENEHFKEIGSLAVKFRFSDDIFVESRGPGVWVVTNGSSVLNNLGEWEYEPRPSSRTDEFIDRTRLAFSDAVRAARALLNKGGRV